MIPRNMMINVINDNYSWTNWKILTLKSLNIPGNLLQTTFLPGLSFKNATHIKFQITQTFVSRD